MHFFETIYQNVIDQGMLAVMLTKNLIDKDLRVTATHKQLFQTLHSKLILPLDRITKVDGIPANKWTREGLKFLCRYRKRIEFTIERTEHYITPNKLSSFLQVFVEQIEEDSGFLDLETAKFVELVKGCTDRLIDMDHVTISHKRVKLVNRYFSRFSFLTIFWRANLTFEMFITIANLLPPQLDWGVVATLTIFWHVGTLFPYE